MTLQAIMNADGEVGHGMGSGITNGTFVIASVPSVFTKAGGKGIYKGPLAGTFSLGDFTGTVPGSVVGSWTIKPTASKVKDDDLLVIRAGDEGTFTGVGTVSPPAVPPTIVVTGPVVVSDAGQEGLNGD